MKHSILSVSVIILVLNISCLGKQNNTAENAISDEQNVQAEVNEKSVTEDQVLLSINPESYPAAPEKLMLNIVNNTDTIIEFGAEYLIERYEEDKWIKVEFTEKILNILVLYTIDPGDSYDYDIFLYPRYTRYTTGRYRIVKNILVYNERKDYSAEFMIE